MLINHKGHLPFLIQLRHLRLRHPTGSLQLYMWRISNSIRKVCLQWGRVVVCEKQVGTAKLARGGTTEGPPSLKP